MPLTIEHSIGMGIGQRQTIAGRPLFVLPGVGDGLNPKITVPTSSDLVASMINQLINSDSALQNAGLEGQIVKAGYGLKALPNLGNLADQQGELGILMVWEQQAGSVDQQRFDAVTDFIKQQPDIPPIELIRRLIASGYGGSGLSLGGELSVQEYKIRLLREIAKTHVPGVAPSQTLARVRQSTEKSVAVRRDQLDMIFRVHRPMLHQLALFQTLSGSSVTPLLLGAGALSVDDFFMANAAVLKTMLDDDKVDDFVVVGSTINDLASSEALVALGDRHFTLWAEINADPDSAAGSHAAKSEAESQCRIHAFVGSGDGAAAVAGYAHRVKNDSNIVLAGTPEEDRYGVFEPQGSQPISKLTARESFVLDAKPSQQEAWEKAQLNALVQSNDGVRATSLVTRCTRPDLRLGVPVRASGLCQSQIADTLGPRLRERYRTQEQLDAAVDAAMRPLEVFRKTPIKIDYRARLGAKDGEVVVNVDYRVPSVISTVKLVRRLFID